MAALQFIGAALAFGIGAGIGLGVTFAIIAAFSDDILPPQKPYKGGPL